MPVRRKANGRWFFRSVVKFPNGLRERIFGMPGTPGPYQDLPNTKAGAVEAETRAKARAHLGTASGPTINLPKGAPVTVESFAPTYLATARAKNKPSSVDAKEQILRTHILPRLGRLPLVDVTYAVVEDLKIALGETPIANVTRRRAGTPVKASTRTLGQKTINNVLTVLRRMLSIAVKRGLIKAVPEIEWYRPAAPDFDFLAFEEADRLVAAAEGEWRTMALVAMRTGLRLGELRGLRWQDVDLVGGRLMVRQSIVRGVVGVPKSGKAREVALGDEVIGALKAHRHLRGPLVFCDMDGAPLEVPQVRYQLARACRKAGLRELGWHVLRHTFASHLAMRGAPLKAIQELLGHATIQMTMRYAHMSPDVARSAVKLLDRAGGVAPTWHRGENRPVST